MQASLCGRRLRSTKRRDQRAKRGRPARQRSQQTGHRRCAFVPKRGGSGGPQARGALESPPEDGTRHGRTEKRKAPSGLRSQDHRPDDKLDHGTGRLSPPSRRTAPGTTPEITQGRPWRREPESNRCKRICSPLRNHSAIAPKNQEINGRPAPESPQSGRSPPLDKRSL